MENEKASTWHIDRRVSLGHLVTTMTVIVAMIAFSFQMQSRIDKNEFRIEQNAKAISELRVSTAVQYNEIIRRLERIDEKADEHLTQHSEK